MGKDKRNTELAVVVCMVVERKKWYQMGVWFAREEISGGEFVHKKDPGRV
jgi:hypothetical protein